ncbi:MAG: hypothetical protein M3077_00085 [Candidatus Dormibacteraeota bacterium]|nr:hypothetical protein [Candidatus Dormibacteraeota bacterium]
MNFRVLAAAGGAAFLLAACGTTATNSGNTSASTSATPAASIKSLSGVGTTVTLDPGTAMVLQQNNVKVAPAAPATADASGGMVKVTFPITGGNVDIYPQNDLPFIRGTVKHSGGLTFSAGGKSLTVTDFIVDPGASTLTATAGGSQVMLLELDGSKVMVGKDGSGHVTLDGTVAKLSQAAADALNQTFGVSLFKRGIPLGTVHIVAA